MRAFILCTIGAMLLGGSAVAHNYCEDGTITMMYPDRAGAGLLALVEGVAPGTIPDGLFYYTIEGTQGGDSYTLTPHDVEQFGPFAIPEFRLAGECASFDMGCYDNGPGDESGTIPGDGDATVILVLGKPMSRFTYCESP